MRFALILVAGLWLWGKSVVDDTVAQQMRSGETDVHHVRVLKRVAIDGEMDLVVALGSPKHRVDGETAWVSWDEQIRIGLYLQRRDEPGKIYRIAVEWGMKDGECFARMERVSATDVVIGCRPEKVGPGMHRKFVYDARAKRLVAFFEYFPYRMERVRLAGDRVIWAGRSDSQRVEMTLQPDGVWGVKAMGVAGERS